MFAKKTKEDFERLYIASQREKEDADRRLEEQTKKLRSLEQDVAALQVRAEQSAEKEAQNIVRKARDFSALLGSEAQKISKIELTKAQERIREEVLSCAKKVTLDKIKSEFKDKRKQDEMIDSQLEKIPKASSS